METIDISLSEEVYSVSRLSREARVLLETHFPFVWVEGEISNFTAPQSGHWYFSLKDTAAQIRCAMFRTQNKRVNFSPIDGLHIFAKVRVSLYEGRGDFQLLIEQMEEVGTGKLQQEFEKLKKKLSTEGLFDDKHKKSLPSYPLQIGVITSPTGAAIRDILSVLNRRYPCVSVIIYPTLVQGELAPSHIVKQIETANMRNECDVLILSRGGGSLEDLWPFNQERVAYAIHHSKIPVVTGIGHEVDFTIADFVADLRAPTPSAAAELVVPDCFELNEWVKKHESRLFRAIKQKFQLLHQQLIYVEKHLLQQHPKRRLHEQQQRLDFFEISLQKLIHKHLDAKQQQLARFAGILDALSPLSVLSRGFAIATRDDKKIIMKSKDVKVGDNIHVQLKKGKISCKVEMIK